MELDHTVLSSRFDLWKVVVGPEPSHCTADCWAPQFDSGHVARIEVEEFRVS